MAYVDLHVHSNRSDGSDPPAMVVERAAAMGIAALALTDHDTVAGVSEAAEAARAHGVHYLPAVELSTWHDGREVHVLALGIDPDATELTALLESQRQGRIDRVVSMLEKLRTLGIDLAELDAGEAGTLGRVHVANALRDAGHVKKTQDAFDRYLRPGRPAFVSKMMVPTAEAIDTVHAAGGLAFVAHPGLNRNVRNILPQLLALPFDGLEAWHISHSPGDIDAFQQLAQERRILVSGGSDCHGTVKGLPEMGKVRTPFYVYERIAEALQNKIARP